MACHDGSAELGGTGPLGCRVSESVGVWVCGRATRIFSFCATQSQSKVVVLR